MFKSLDYALVKYREDVLNIESPSPSSFPCQPWKLPIKNIDLQFTLRLPMTVSIPHSMYRCLTAWTERARHCWCQDRTRNTISSKKRHQGLPMGQRVRGSLLDIHQLHAVSGRQNELTHAEERRNTGTLDLENVIIRTDREVLTGKSE